MIAINNIFQISNSNIKLNSAKKAPTAIFYKYFDAMKFLVSYEERLV